jgi:iron-sulfur cluster assembly accessory protein
MAATEENPMENNPYFLRVYVDSGGCSGFEYKFELDNELDDEEDHVIVSRKDDENGEERSPRVVVDETSLGFLKGATLDYVVEMIKSSFVVRDNPQSESACGCGSSFAVKNFSANPARD